MKNASNNAKILVEFSEEEISWLADRLHEECARGVSAKAIVSGLKNGNLNVVEQHLEMERRLRLRLLNKAVEQGFGDL